MMIFVHILESAKNGPQKILALCKKLKGYRKLIKIKTVATHSPSDIIQISLKNKN